MASKAEIEAVKIFEEFLRCVESKKLPADHQDDDEFCEEGTCFWIGEQARKFVERVRRQKGRGKR